MQYHSRVVCAFLVATLCSFPLHAQGQPAVGHWNFDGDLRDRSGSRNDALAESPQYGNGHSGEGLICGGKPVIVPDTAQLRLAPGLRVECWAKIDAIGRSWQPLLIKDGDYQLRIDPPREGGHFSFFVDADGWEPRVRSELVAKVGVWYHLAAGWDGQEIWIEVNGQRTSRARTGTPGASREPLELGLFEGILDEVRIENPAARFSGVAQWKFDGDLRDSSGHEYHLTGKKAEFASGPGGVALTSEESKFQVASNADFQLAPGLRIDCSVYFDEVPSKQHYLIMKNGEYQLRLNSSKEGGCFAFFVNLDGWEPRVTSEQRVVPGRWYRVIANWDGFVLALDVNGQRTRVTRSGLPHPTDNPLVVGALGGRIDSLTIENPRLPTMQVPDVRQSHAILRAGRAEKLTATIRNMGMDTEQATVALQLPPGVRCNGSPRHELGTMPMGTEKVVEWDVQAGEASIGSAEIRVTAAGAPTLTARHLLVFFPEDDLPVDSSLKQPTEIRAGAGMARTYYVDSQAGDNANDGTSPESAWKDFTNINGRTLGPGERLLIRRGSVINQELTVSARGTAERWAEIGTYGTGPRPMIRRNWHIQDRCALIANPDYLRIHGLVVCHAAKGLIVTYTDGGHRGLLIEDCIAHHIEGLYRPNSHGIPEWRDLEGPGGDALNSSAGIAVTGAPATDVVLRDCEMFQASWGYRVQGTDVVVDRVYCHDNFVRNTSPHPAVTTVRRSVLKNCIFDASGWHASAGTMGIMLVNPQGLIIRNCFFRNQPDSGSHDEGGIDFEAHGNGCLIDHCTFENNAGAAIEVLGLRSPQIKNLEIRNSRFIKNNTADKLGPSEIFVWGRSRDPAVCCSTGTIRNNGHVTLPSVEFFVNEAPKSTSWALDNNTAFATVDELEKAMPYNRPPTVDAGNDIRTDRLSFALNGTVTDDGKPEGKPLSVTWEVLEGAGCVMLHDAKAPNTVATFERSGDYTLRLVADDGELWLSDMVDVHILPAGATVAAAWEFNAPLDKEGWTEVNPGTQLQKWSHPQWPTTSHPVKYVAGGYYLLAIENSSDAHLLSPDDLNLELTGRETVTLRFQNHTPASRMRLRFTTEADSNWDDAKSQTFAVVADDNCARTYSLDMSAVTHWKGQLRRLRLDLASGKPLTGTCRFDYIWITRSEPR